MKISSSSSIIFATLAISSSSSSLAAPTGDTSHSEGTMASSSSNHQLATRHDATSTRPFGRSDLRDNEDDEQPKLSTRYPDAGLEERDDLLDSLLCPMLGLIPGAMSLVGTIPVLGGTIKCPTSTAASAESVGDGPATVEQIQSALASASSALLSQASNLPVSPPISLPNPPLVPISAVLGAAPVPVPTVAQGVLARDVAPTEPSAAPTPPSAPASAPGTPSPSAPPNTPKPPSPPAPGVPAPPANAPGAVTSKAPVPLPVGGSGSA
ncbi:hypothetical protein BD779DRAFT_1465214 [Infundibulicybe gibba]|nr:hypothetical protein BD779DRAFT_1465214 [Infundibulicybe gibba]